MYVRLIDNQPTVCSWSQFRKENPDISVRSNPSLETLSELGLYPLVVKGKPDLQPWQRIVRQGDPYQDAQGQWVVDWVVEDIAASPERVKAEAQKRIYSVLPSWKQRNLTARAAELAIKGRDNWTAEELSEYEAGQSVWNTIKAIRAASDALEAMDPVPKDYMLDKWWP